MSETTGGPPRGRLPGRFGDGIRDMGWSLVVLFVVIGVIVGFFGACQFSPGGPNTDPNAVPAVNAPAELGTMAREVSFPVRAPAVPGDWRATSANTASLGTVAVAKVGWLTPTGQYLRLGQSPAGPAQIIADETGRFAGELAPEGSVDVEGVRWDVFPAKDAERAWVAAEPDGVRLMITGSGSEAEYRTLARAAWTATPLPGR